MSNIRNIYLWIRFAMNHDDCMEKIHNILTQQIIIGHLNMNLRSEIDGFV